MLIRHIALLLLLATAFVAGASHAADYYARTAGAGTITTNWNQNTTWTTSNTCNGAALGAGVFPGSGDNVFICSGKTVNVTANAQASSVTFLTNTPNAGTNSSLVHSSGISLTVGSGGVTINTSSGTNGTRQWNIGAGSATVNGDVSLVENSANNSRIANITITTGSLDVNGDLTINVGNNARGTITMSGGAGNLFLSGSFLLSQGFGTLTPGTTSTFTYDTASTATAASGAAVTYANLVINKSGGSATAASTGTLTIANLTVQNGTFSTYTANNVSVTGNLLVQAGALFDIATTGTAAFNATAGTTTTATGELRISAASGTKTFTGNVTISATTGKWNNTGDVAIALGGNLDNNNTAANFISGAGAYTCTNTRTFGGTGGGLVFQGNLVINGQRTANTPVTVQGNMSGNNAFINAAGPAEVVGNITVTTLTNNANQLFRIGGNANGIGTLTATAAGNTIEYNGTGAQTMETTTYHHLVISNAVGPVATGGNISVQGNFTNDGNFDSVTGTDTVTFNGSAAQTISGTATVSGSPTNLTTFYNLTINNATGVSLTGTHSATVPNTLTLTAGALKTGSSNVVFVSRTATGAIARTSGFVEGNLKWTVPTGTNVARTFPVGTGTTYAPVVLTFASVTAAGNVTVSSAAGSHANLSSSGLDDVTPHKLNRYWTITNDPVPGSGIGFSAAGYAATFTFVAGDVDPGATPAAFVVTRFASGAWNPTTEGAATATSIAIGSETGFGAFAAGESKSYNASVGRFNAYDPPPVTPANSVQGNIRTKTAGTAFTLTIVHLTAAALSNMGATGSLTVALIDASNPTGAFDATTDCYASWVSATPITSVTVNVTATTQQQWTTPNITVTNAYKDVRVRVTTALGGGQTGCSSDRFAVKPQSFGIVVSDGTSSTAGSTNSLNATTYNGTPIHKAGQPFSVRVNSAVPATASNYYQSTTHAGTPAQKTVACANPTGTHPTFGACSLTCTTGAFSAGGFSIVGGELNSTATYGEAGMFDLVFEDANFADVDAADTALAVRTISQTSAIRAGRFVPNDFVLTHNNPSLAQFRTFGATDSVCNASASPRRSFTYVGQNFGYAIAPQLLVTARNGLASPTTTTNYQQCLWELSGSGVVNSPTTSNVGKTLGSTLSNPAIAPANNGSGTGTVTLSSSDLYSFTRGTTPDTPFNGLVNLVITATDSDGIASNTLTISSLPFDSGSEFRFGRLRMSSASGSQLLALVVPLVAEYWNGTTFLMNAADQCTAIDTSNIGLGNYRGTLVSGDTTASVSGPFANGLKSVGVTKPAGGHTGSVDLVVNLGTTTTINTCNTWDVPTPTPGGASLAHLRGKWCGSAYDRDPVARIRYGVLGRDAEVIHIQETLP